MLFTSYAVLLGAGLIANVRDWRMLVLTAVIGANVFAPIPRTSAEEFYLYCVIAEVCVILVAALLRAESTAFVVEVAIVLIVLHVMAYHIDGHPALSPYRFLVKLCEYLQLCSCVFFSKGFLPHLRNRML